VLETVVGYTGGTTASPTYESIGDHTEALRVVYDPSQVTYDELLAKFWREHDPMPMEFTGYQYRSAVFYHDGSQLAAAERRLGGGSSPFATSASKHTKLEPAETFYRAEEYHQQFLAKATGRAVSVGMHQ